MAFQHAIENQVMQRNAGIEGIADDIVEVKSAQPPGLGKSIRVNDDQHAKFLGLSPEGGESGVRKLATGHVAQYLYALETQLLYAALEFDSGCRPVLQR